MKTKKKGRSTYKLSAQDKIDIQILERAAEFIIKRERYCICHAIDAAANYPYYTRASEMIESIFKKDSDRPQSAFYWELIYDSRKVDNPRIFALLLTIELIKTNSLP